jgi:hypothetical protein
VGYKKQAGKKEKFEKVGRKRKQIGGKKTKKGNNGDKVIKKDNIVNLQSYKDRQHSKLRSYKERQHS